MFGWLSWVHVHTCGRVRLIGRCSWGWCVGDLCVYVGCAHPCTHARKAICMCTWIALSGQVCGFGYTRYASILGYSCLPLPALSATQWPWAGPEAWGQLVSSHQGAAEAEQGLLQDGSPLSWACEALGSLPLFCPHFPRSPQASARLASGPWLRLAGRPRTQKMDLRS